MITKDCRPEFKVFYHGSSTFAGIGSELVPPCITNVLSETGRKKNLDRVFFTTDIGLARIYAGRAANSYGGDPVVYRVVSPVNAVCMNDTKGASVYHASSAFVELIA